MPNIFKPKRSSTASSVPTISNLADGELAVNTADQKIYVRSGASIVTVGSVSVGGGSGVSISTNTTNQSQYLTYASATGTAAGLGVTTTGLVFNPSSGNLGIGTTNPTEKLTVTGNALVTGIVTVRNANTQDGITLLGRSGGTGSFDVILTPTTLSADRTLTLPDVTGTVALTSQIPTVDVTAAGNNAFTGANTFTNATGQTIRSAATQDAVVLAGRAGGTSSFAVTLTPTTLASNTTLTLPNVTGTVITTGDTATVTNTMLSTVATSTIRGRVTAGTGVVENLTGTQATTLLDTFTSALKGLAPASGGGTTNFLRADGTWAAPPSGSGGTSTPQYGIIIASTYGMFMP